MNIAILTGRPTKDPDIRLYGANNDKKMARYTLAVDRNIKKDPNNPDQQTADFISCVCYGYAADFADNYLRKGMKIAVTGRIQTGRYQDKNDNTVYTTDVVVDKHEFCESKGSGNNDSHQQAPQQKTANAAAQPKPQQASPADTAFVNIPEGLDEELPFT